MKMLIALLVAAAALAWPVQFGRRRLAILPAVPPTSALTSSFTSVGTPAETRSRSALVGGLRWGHGRRDRGVSPADLLGLLEAIAPALEAGIAPASALRIAADSRSGSGCPDRLAALARDMASAAADGAMLGPLWRVAADSAGSAELMLLAQAWSLSENLGAPLAHAVRTTAGLLEARLAHERRLAAAVAGARATVNLLTVLPLAGPLLALVLGIGPGELFGGSQLTQGSLALGLCLAGIGRIWVRRMVRGVARGPMIA
jgi:tight adherence protein B